MVITNSHAFFCKPRTSHKYTMIRDYIDVVGDMIRENSKDGMFVEKKTKKLRLDRNCDKDGFYLEPSSAQLELFYWVCTHTGTSASTMAEVDLLWFAKHFEIPNEILRKLMDSVSIVKRKSMCL